MWKILIKIIYTHNCSVYYYSLYDDFITKTIAKIFFFTNFILQIKFTNILLHKYL